MFYNQKSRLPLGCLGVSMEQRDSDPNALHRGHHFSRFLARAVLLFSDPV